ncbi:MAG: VOC family protein [Chloroflexi bacterium]|nr:VOC family protein [Chloroflexota bacterium]
MPVEITLKMVKIPVSDVERAAPFYREVLGLREDFVVPEYGWAQFSAGDMPVALYVPGKGGGNGTAGATDSVHFCITQPDDFRQQLRAAGLDPDAHLHQGNDGTTFFELQDPDGNTFKVIVAQPENTD